MKIAKLVILVAGLISSAASVWLVMADESEIWDAFNSLIGLMGGPMTGLFMLGIFFNEQCRECGFRNYYQRHYRAGRTLCH